MNLTPSSRSAAIAVLSCLLLSNPGALAQEVPEWVIESNAHTLYVLQQMATIAPESAARNGLDGIDEQITIMGPDLVRRSEAMLEETIAELRRRLEKIEDPRVRQDIEILIASQDLQLRQTRANDELVLPYINVPQMLFYSMNGLLDPALPRERQEAALVRLRRYAGVEEGYTPITELARALYESRAGDENLIGPYRGELERNLSTSPQFMAGIGQLFAGLKIEDYEDTLEVLKEQVGVYDEWVRTEVMSRARDDFRQPDALYALALEQWGVDATPAELIGDALAGYMEIRNEMQALAPLVAAEMGWDLIDYRDVIRELKKDQFPYGTILERYQETNTALEAIIREQGIVSIPDRPLAIRLATEAESANIRQPHLSQPRFVGNTGELIEFLIPPLPEVPEGETPPVSDFSFEAMRWTLSAHEARPGHELQFSAMVEGGVSDARGLFAFNSVNVEGWALYAEAEVKPYLPLDGQLIGLQGRLWRAARMFLDPMLNTGQISVEEARRILLEDVVLTPASVDAELTRYTFQIPGQATAYLYGYKKLMELKGYAELTLGDRFDLQAYHDFVLAQGLLPPALLARAVREEFVPAQLPGEEAL
jgi:polyhydroxyalkanoate synthesis regulator phasin